MEATKDRVDPMAKRTRPLVEYVQSCNDCSDLTDLWDFQARVSAERENKKGYKHYNYNYHCWLSKNLYLLAIKMYYLG